MPTADYLQKLSQRVYNLIQIIRTHCKDPVEIDKELMRFYSIERNDLADLLSKPLPGLNFMFNTGVLIPGLISNYYDTRKNKFNIEIAKNMLGDLLAEIQNKRVGPATTGVEDGLLKNYLDHINEKKDKLAEERILRTQKSPEMVDNRTVLQKTKSKIIEMRKFPENLAWEEITIKFIDGNDVHITTQRDSYQTNYELMGFQNEKTKKPNAQWKLLKLLALNGGSLNWGNNRIMTAKEIDKISKRKQLLSYALKTYFNGVKDDPFYKYNKEDGYRIRINLISEQGSNTEDDSDYKIEHENVNFIDADDPDTEKIMSKD